MPKTNTVKHQEVIMKNKIAVLFLCLAMLALSSCVAPHQQDKFNTQRGAAIGAGIGALAGQAVGRDTGASLLGAGIGTLLGAIIGNAVDQSHMAGTEAAKTNKRVVYYDDRGGALEAIPGPVDQQTQCRKVTKRVWENGRLIKETVEEICEGEKYTKEY